MSDLEKPAMLRRSFTAKRSATSGFTLIELLVTLLIAAILTVISLAYYQRAARRFSLQSEAVNLAARLEQAKSLAQAQSTEYRILVDSSGYTPQFLNPRGSTNWVAADAVSSGKILINTNVTLGTGSVGSAPQGQPSIAQSAEIRFNSRGFPVATGTPPTSPKQDNAVYLTDTRDVFAVTVNILGRVQVWVYDGTNGIWVTISR